PRGAGAPGRARLAGVAASPAGRGTSGEQSGPRDEHGAQDERSLHTLIEVSGHHFGSREREKKRRQRRSTSRLPGEPVSHATGTHYRSAQFAAHRGSMTEPTLSRDRKVHILSICLWASSW